MNIAPIPSVFKETSHAVKNGELPTTAALPRSHKVTRQLFLTSLIISLSGCATSPIVQTNNPCLENCSTTPVETPKNQCIGNNDLPVEYAGAFEETVDDPLLSRAIGNTNKGSLCQAKVYVSKSEVKIPLYRAWNSTNPNSRLGKWWAFNLPDGKIAQYRSDYEICYQFSPLDKLTQCTLKPNTKVVIGTGQSMTCDAYLTYPVSASKQIYLEIDPKSASVSDCKDYDGVFNWKPSAGK